MTELYFEGAKLVKTSGDGKYSFNGATLELTGGEFYITGNNVKFANLVASNSVVKIDINTLDLVSFKAINHSKISNAHIKTSSAILWDSELYDSDLVVLDARNSTINGSAIQELKATNSTVNNSHIKSLNTYESNISKVQAEYIEFYMGKISDCDINTLVTTSDVTIANSNIKSLSAKYGDYINIEGKVGVGSMDLGRTKFDLQYSSMLEVKNAKALFSPYKVNGTGLVHDIETNKFYNTQGREVKLHDPEMYSQKFQAAYKEFLHEHTMEDNQLELLANNYDSEMIL